MSPGRTSARILTESALCGVALGVLFTALLVLSGDGPARHLLPRPDAILPVLCLLVNMSALFATAVLATSFAFSDRDAGSRDERPGGGCRALVPVRVVARRSTRRCAGAGSA